MMIDVHGLCNVYMVSLHDELKSCAHIYDIDVLLHLMVFMATGISLLEPPFTGLSDLVK